MSAGLEGVTARSYDAIAGDYEAAFADEFAGLLLERAMLRVLVESMPGTGPVLDIGCGTGEVLRYLADLGADLGVEAVGMDISTGMLARAAVADPGARLAVGSMTSLPVADGALHAIVAHYSIIHVADETLPDVFAEFARCCVSGAPVLLAFQDGARVRHLDQAYGHRIDLDFRFRDPERVAELLAAAGFEIRATVRRAAQPGESGPRAIVLAAAS